MKRRRNRAERASSKQASRISKAMQDRELTVTRFVEQESLNRAFNLAKSKSVGSNRVALTLTANEAWMQNAMKVAGKEIREEVLKKLAKTPPKHLRGAYIALKKRTENLIKENQQIASELGMFSDPEQN